MPRSFEQRIKTLKKNMPRQREEFDFYVPSCYFAETREGEPRPDDPIKPEQSEQFEAEIQLLGVKKQREFADRYIFVKPSYVFPPGPEKLNSIVRRGGDPNHPFWRYCREKRFIVDAEQCYRQSQCSGCDVGPLPIDIEN